jgi:uncharacterized protein (TIGR02271 family)
MNKKKSDQPNRDPLTREPGTYSGTAGGAVAGGAAGAAGGVPITTTGYGGHTAEHFNPTEASELGRFIDYTVVDLRGDKIGTIDAVWEDHTGQPAYLAIRTGWLGLGKAHVVPAHSAEVSETRQIIRLPYDADAVKDAPSFDSNADITRESERTVADYYRRYGYQPRTEEWPEERTDRTTEKRYVDEPLAGNLPEKSRDEATMKLRKEDVKIGKREVEYGGVRLRKIVRTETVNKPVELKREEIVVERTPLHGETAERGDINLRDEEIYIPLRREEPVVDKSVKATEQIRVGKRTETDRQEVSEQFRREDVEIDEKAGNRKNRPTP